MTGYHACPCLNRESPLVEGFQAQLEMVSWCDLFLYLSAECRVSYQPPPPLINAVLRSKVMKSPWICHVHPLRTPHRHLRAINVVAHPWLCSRSALTCSGWGRMGRRRIGSGVDSPWGRFPLRIFSPAQVRYGSLGFGLFYPLLCNILT